MQFTGNRIKLFIFVFLFCLGNYFATEKESQSIQDEIDRKEKEKENLQESINELKKKKYLIHKNIPGEFPFDQSIRLLGSFGPLQSTFNLAAGKMENERLFSVSFPKDFFEYYNANKNNSFILSYYNKRNNFGIDLNVNSFKTNITGSFLSFVQPDLFFSNQNLKYESSIVNAFKLFRIFNNHNIGPSFGLVYNYGKFGITSSNLKDKISSLNETYAGLGIEIGIRYKVRVSENWYIDFGYNANSTKNDFNSTFASNYGNNLFYSQMIGQNPQLLQFNYSGKNNLTINSERVFLFFEYAISEEFGFSFGWQSITRFHRINNAAIDQTYSLPYKNLSSESLNSEALRNFLLYYQNIESKTYIDYLNQFFIGCFRTIN